MRIAVPQRVPHRRVRDQRAVAALPDIQGIVVRHDEAVVNDLSRARVDPIGVLGLGRDELDAADLVRPRDVAAAQTHLHHRRGDDSDACDGDAVVAVGLQVH